MSNRRVSLPGASELFRSTAKHNSFSDTDKAQDGLDAVSYTHLTLPTKSSAHPLIAHPRIQVPRHDPAMEHRGMAVSRLLEMPRRTHRDPPWIPVLPPRTALPRPRGARPDPAGVADGYVMMRRSPSTSVPRNSWHWRMHVCSCVPKGWQPIEDASYGKPSPSPWPTSTFAAPSPHWSPVWTNET